MPASIFPIEAVRGIYFRANTQWPCDPISLAKRMGLRLAPLEDRSLTHQIVETEGEMWLLYRQEDHGDGDRIGPKTGLNVYRGIVEYHGGDAETLAELILPRSVAQTTPLPLILAAQPFVPKKYITDRYAELKGSGTRVRMRP